MNLTKLQPTLAAGLLSLTLMFTSHPSSANILDGSYDDNNDNDNYNAEQQLSNQRWLQYQQQVANQQVTLNQNSSSAYSNYDATATSSSADTTDSQVTDSQVTDQNVTQKTKATVETTIAKQTTQSAETTPAHFSSVEPVTVMLNHQESNHPLVEQPQLTAGNRFLPLTNLSQVLNQQIREAPMTTWNLLNLNTNNPLANNVIGNNRPFDNLQQYYQW